MPLKYTIDDETGCWNSDRYVEASGYTKTSYQGKMQPSHRVSYMLYKGEIPKGMFVLHTCDNRICCNPEHLFLGTHQDNMDDLVSKGKARKASLTIEQMQALSDTGMPQWRIAEIAGVTQTRVSQLLNPKFREQSRENTRKWRAAHPEHKEAKKQYNKELYEQCQLKRQQQPS